MDDDSRKRSQPVHETPSEKQSTQEYIGIRKTSEGWLAKILIKDDKYFYGPFKSKEEAAVAHDKLAIQLHRVKGRFNYEQPKFAAQVRFVEGLEREQLIKMVRDGSYEEKFNEFLKNERSQECRELFRREIGRGDSYTLKIRNHYASQLFPRGIDREKSLVPQNFSDLMGKTWTFQCMYGYDDVYLVGEWSKFRRQNCLKVGDDVIFCETKDGKRLIKIERKTQSENSKDPCLLPTPSTSEPSTSTRTATSSQDLSTELQIGLPGSAKKAKNSQHLSTQLQVGLSNDLIGQPDSAEKAKRSQDLSTELQLGLSNDLIGQPDSAKKAKGSQHLSTELQVSLSNQLSRQPDSAEKAKGSQHLSTELQLSLSNKLRGQPNSVEKAKSSQDLSTKLQLDPSS